MDELKEQAHERDSVPDGETNRRDEADTDAVETKQGEYISTKNVYHRTRRRTITNTNSNNNNYYYLIVYRHISGI